MWSVLSWFTVRGASFIAAGAVGILAGLTLGSDALTSVGALLICLPVFSALTARRARYQLRCERKITPSRVAPGQSARVTIRLENVSRISTGLLLAEETIPYALGTRPRYVLNGIERGGSREVSYQLRSDLRGKYAIGPLQIRIADVFGLVELTASFATQSTLTVTPKVVPLISASTTGSWSSDGDGRTRMTAAAGDDDVIPRAYRDGDELRRLSACDRQRPHAAFECCHALLEDGRGRVHDARIDVAEFLECEQVRGMFGIAELIRRGLIDRHRNGAGRRIGAPPGVQCKRFGML